MSDKVIGLIRTGGVILLFIIGVILLLGAMTTELDPDTGEPIGDVSAVVNSVNYALYMGYAALGAIVIFSIWSVVQNPKKFITTAIGLGVFGIILLIGYSMASSTMEGSEATAKSIKTAGAGIKTTYILAIVALSLIVVGSVMSMMRYFSKS